jgi:hypothetical protein
MIWTTGNSFHRQRPRGTRKPESAAIDSPDGRIIHRYLDKQRTALLAKLDGVSERDVRWPMTENGTNLLGLVKHVASIELGYFGEVFDRPSHIPLPWFDDGAELNADMWATAEQPREETITLYQRAATHADGTIEALSLVEFPGGPLTGRRSPCNSAIVVQDL